jgi:N4-gp56 family major capsid protein
MPQTVIPFGSPLALKAQSVGLFATTMQRRTNLNRLTGPMPKQADAEARLRLQTSTAYPVVRAMDLTKQAGDEITFDLINKTGGKPIMGERMAEGRGARMSFSQDRLRINQTRYPISAGGKMTQQRTPHELRSLARAQGQGYMDQLVDQLTVVHLAGARGFHTNEWVVPTEADPDLPEIAVNPIKAPTYNRHFIAMSDGIEHFGQTAGDVNLLSTETMNLDVVDAIAATMDSMGYAPTPVKFDGDEMADDAPLRVLMVSAEQYMGFVKSGNIRLLQSQAAARSTNAKMNPIFRGDAGIWDNILILKMPKPIRFYAGNIIRYCADPTTEVESTATVPASFGTGFAVDRALLLGAQALAQAFGKESRSGVPFFWSEKLLDHDDKLEVLIGMIAGMSKIRFLVDQDGVQLPTDNGVIAIDTAVKIATQ